MSSAFGCAVPEATEWLDYSFLGMRPRAGDSRLGSGRAAETRVDRPTQVPALRLHGAHLGTATMKNLARLEESMTCIATPKSRGGWKPWFLGSHTFWLSTCLPILLDSSPLRHVRYSKQFKGIWRGQPLRLARRLRGSARSTPRVQPGPQVFACELSGFSA
jgi:hypothetical protein